MSAFLMLDLDWERINDWLVTHGLRILFIVLIAAIITQVLRHLVPCVVGVAVARQLTQPADEVKRRADTISFALQATLGTFVLLIALFMIVAEVGVNIAPLLTGAGIVGVALGFGAQTLVRDLIKGFFILLDNQYSRGDLVTIAGITGIVEEVTLRRTVLSDENGVIYYIPNGEITVATNRTKAQGTTS